MPAEGRGGAGQRARRRKHGRTRGGRNRVHETRRAGRASEKGGRLPRSLRARGVAALGFRSLRRQAAPGVDGQKLRGLCCELGPEPAGSARTTEERALPGASHSASAHPERERENSARSASPRSKIAWCKRRWPGSYRQFSSKISWNARMVSARSGVRIRRSTVYGKE